MFFKFIIVYGTRGIRIACTFELNVNAATLCPLDALISPPISFLLLSFDEFWPLLFFTLVDYQGEGIVENR
jgi:hypothetical protein